MVLIPQACWLRTNAFATDHVTCMSKDMGMEPGPPTWAVRPFHQVVPTVPTENLVVLSKLNSSMFTSNGEQNPCHPSSFRLAFSSLLLFTWSGKRRTLRDINPAQEPTQQKQYIRSSSYQKVTNYRIASVIFPFAFCSVIYSRSITWQHPRTS